MAQANTGQVSTILILWNVWQQSGPAEDPKLPGLSTAQDRHWRVTTRMNTSPKLREISHGAP